DGLRRVLLRADGRDGRAGPAVDLGGRARPLGRRLRLLVRRDRGRRLLLLVAGGLGRLVRLLLAAEQDRPADRGPDRQDHRAGDQQQARAAPRGRRRFRGPLLRGRPPLGRRDGLGLVGDVLPLGGGGNGLGDGNGRGEPEGVGRLLLRGRGERDRLAVGGDLVEPRRPRDRLAAGDREVPDQRPQLRVAGLPQLAQQRGPGRVPEVGLGEQQVVAGVV